MSKGGASNEDALDGLDCGSFAYIQTGGTCYAVGVLNMITQSPRLLHYTLHITLSWMLSMSDVQRFQLWKMANADPYCPREAFHQRMAFAARLIKSIHTNRSANDGEDLRVVVGRTISPKLHIKPADGLQHWTEEFTKQEDYFANTPDGLGGSSQKVLLKFVRHALGNYQDEKDISIYNIDSTGELTAIEIVTIDPYIFTAKTKGVKSGAHPTPLLLVLNMDNLRVPFKKRITFHGTDYLLEAGNILTMGGTHAIAGVRCGNEFMAVDSNEPYTRAPVDWPSLGGSISFDNMLAKYRFPDPHDYILLSGVYLQESFFSHLPTTFDIRMQLQTVRRAWHAPFAYHIPISLQLKTIRVTGFCKKRDPLNGRHDLTRSDVGSMFVTGLQKGNAHIEFTEYSNAALSMQTSLSIHKLVEPPSSPTSKVVNVMVSHASGRMEIEVSHLSLLTVINRLHWLMVPHMTRTWWAKTFMKDRVTLNAQLIKLNEARTHERQRVHDKEGRGEITSTLQASVDTIMAERQSASPQSQRPRQPQRSPQSQRLPPINQPTTRNNTLRTSVKP